MLWREGCRTIVSLAVAAVAVVVCQGKAVRSPATLPMDQFRCEEDGKFPMLEFCDAYYDCSSWGGETIKTVVQCDAGTVFDDETNSCLGDFSVVSHRECILQVSSEDSNAPLNSITDAPLLSLQAEDASPSITPAPADFRSVQVEALTPDVPLGNGVTETTVAPQVFNALIVHNFTADSFDFDVIFMNGTVSLPGFVDDELDLHENEDIIVSPETSEFDSNQALDHVVNHQLPGETGEPDPFETTAATSNHFETSTVGSDHIETTTMGSDHFQPTATGSYHFEATTMGSDHFQFTTMGSDHFQTTADRSNRFQTNAMGLDRFQISATGLDQIEPTVAGSDHFKTTTASPHEDTLKIVKISKKACQSIGIIDNYVNSMVSIAPLRSSHLTETPYKKALLGYKAALERGKNCAVIWRNGNDIENDIKEIFYLAKQYELEFDRKYDISLKRRHLPSTASIQNRKDGLLEDIRKLEQEVEANERALAFVQPSSQLVIINLLNRKKAILENKYQQLQSQNSGTGFLSLAAFLGLVDQEAQLIRNKTNDSQARLSTWLDNLSKIQTVIREYSWGLSRFAEGFKTNNANVKVEIGKHNNMLRRLRREKEILETSMRVRDGIVLANIEKIKGVQNAIQRKHESHDRRVRSFCDPNGPNSADLRELLLYHKTIEKACRVLKQMISPPDITIQLKALQDKLNRVTAENELLLNKKQEDRETVKSLQNEQRKREKKVQKLRALVRRLETEVRRIQVFLSQQEEAKKAWWSAKPKIQELTEEIDQVGEIFQILHVNLGDMIRQVQEGLATGKGDDTEFFQSLQDKIDQSLIEVQSQLDGSSDMIEDIRNCP